MDEITSADITLDVVNNKGLYQKSVEVPFIAQYCGIIIDKQFLAETDDIGYAELFGSQDNGRSWRQMAKFKITNGPLIKPSDLTFPNSYCLVKIPDDLNITHVAVDLNITKKIRAASKVVFYK